MTAHQKELFSVEPDGTIFFQVLTKRTALPEGEFLCRKCENWVVVISIKTTLPYCESCENAFLSKRHAMFTPWKP